jgi:hypothetical protein
MRRQVVRGGRGVRCETCRLVRGAASQSSGSGGKAYADAVSRVTDGGVVFWVLCLVERPR